MWRPAYATCRKAARNARPDVGWRWHFTPGHAAGTRGFFPALQSVLLAGERLRSTGGFEFRSGYRGAKPRICRPAPRRYTLRWDSKRIGPWNCWPTWASQDCNRGRSIGDPMSTRPMAVGLADLARDFPRGCGRYANEPARVQMKQVSRLQMPPG